MAKVNKSLASNSFARFHDYTSLKGVWSWPNYVPLFICLKINKFDPMWTTIVLSFESIGIWNPSAFSNALCHSFTFSISTLNHISSITPRMLLCNISTSGKMVGWPIKSQTIVNIFEDHRCNVSKKILYICTLEKTHQKLGGPIGCPTFHNDVRTDKKHCPCIPPIYQWLEFAINHIKYLNWKRPHPSKHALDRLVANCICHFFCLFLSHSQDQITIVLGDGYLDWWWTAQKHIDLSFERRPR
jgi:hypothetical protein